jgi:hypothetical protein
MIIIITSWDDGGNALLGTHFQCLFLFYALFIFIHKVIKKEGTIFPTLKHELLQGVSK